jgi:hypothetical protein
MRLSHIVERSTELNERRKREDAAVNAEYRRRKRNATEKESING